MALDLALNNGASLFYDDDGRIVDVCSRKIDLLQLPPLVNAPTSLADALAGSAGEFVFVRVAEASRRLTFT